MAVEYTLQFSNILTTEKTRSETAWFSADGKRIHSACGDKTVRINDAKTGKHVRLLKNQAAEEESYGTKVQGANGITRRIYASTMAEAYDNTVKLWDRETGKCEAVLQGHRGWVNSAIYSNDGKTIVTGSEDKTVRLWDAEKGTHASVCLRDTSAAC